MFERVYAGLNTVPSTTISSISTDVSLLAGVDGEELCVSILVSQTDKSMPRDSTVGVPLLEE